MKNYTLILILLLATISCASAEDQADYSERQNPYPTAFRCDPRDY